MGGWFYENIEYPQFVCMYVESQSNWSILKSNNFSNKVSQTIFDSAILVFGINLAGYNIVISLVCPSVHPFVCVSVCPSVLFFLYTRVPTVVICYLIRPCDIVVCITYLISHSSSLTCNLRIFQFGCIINTKLPSCDDIIHLTSLGFPSWCPESTRPTDSCFQGTSCEILMMYGRLYQHTRVVLYMYTLTMQCNISKVVIWTDF